ncbi:basic helix-loop-helix transcription factor [Lithospermum erythrorhizon]|uniref:Basic helix-loop-helix transcription factor n=1 Tax=Lithospermum erythrorhizon TaxID=34254 RepID=A0AAV3Q9Z4_LITER
MYSVDQDKLQFDSYFGWLESQLCGNSEDSTGNWDKESVPILQSQVLDDDYLGELSAASGGAVKTAGGLPIEAKSAAALKSHSESERRRRERINSRLATLRCLVPSKEKMDKAALLAEVVTQVKQLKKTAAEASKGLFIPTDSDEVQVAYLHNHNAGDGSIYFKASICFELIPEFMAELKRTIAVLPVSLVKAEISTLGNRMKYDMLFKKVTTEIDLKHKENAPEVLRSSILEALSSIYDKVALILEYSPRTPRIVPSNKRQKVSYNLSSSSSSS